MMKRFLLGVLPTCLAIFVAGPIINWYLDSEPPFELVDYKLVTPEVVPGGYFAADFTLHRSERRASCKVDALRAIIDGQNVMYVVGVFPIPQGAPGEDRVRIRIKVPDEAAPGNARYRATAIYSCNPYQVIVPQTHNFEDRHFKIVPKDGPPPT